MAAFGVNALQFNLHASIFLPPAAVFDNTHLHAGQKNIVRQIIRHPESNQFVVLVDAGRIHTIHEDHLRGDAQAAPLPARYDYAIGVVRNQRIAVGFQSGFKSRAGVLLFDPIPDGRSDSLDVFLASHELRSDLRCLVAYTARALGGDAWCHRAVRVRIDIEYVMREADEGAAAAAPVVPASRQARIVTIGGEDFMVPFIYSSERMRDDDAARGAARIITSIAAPQAAGGAMRPSHQLNGFIGDFLESLQLFLDRARAEDGSGLVLDKIIGAFAWVTPTNVAGAGFGAASAVRISKGLLPDNPRVKDNFCIARSIVAALDPEIHSRLDSSLVSIRAAALKAAHHDARLHAARKSPLTDTMTARLAAAEAAYIESKAIATKAMYSPEPSESRAYARFAAIEYALRGAMSGSPPAHLPSFSHAFFKHRQPIDATTVEFIRRTIAVANVKVNFWFRSTATGHAVLTYADEGADLAYLNSGGRIVNLLCDNAHVSAMTCVTSVCYPVSKTNHHKYCGLCGAEFPHTTPASRFQTGTLLLVHQEAACSRALHGESVWPALSKNNVRQLPARSFRACFGLPLHVTVSMDCDLALSVHGCVSTPFGQLRLPAPGKETPLAAFLARWGREPRSSALFSHVRRQLPTDAHAFDTPLLFQPIEKGTMIDDDLDFSVLRASARAVLSSILSPSYAGMLFLAAGVHFPLDSSQTAAPAAAADKCYYCRAPLGGPPRDERLRMLADSLSVEVGASYEDDAEIAATEAAVAFAAGVAAPAPLSESKGVVTDSHALTGLPILAHAMCADTARRSVFVKTTAYIDVAEQNTLDLLLEASSSRALLDGLCAGKPPSVLRNGRHIRSFTLEVPVQSAGLLLSEGSSLKRSREDSGAGDEESMHGRRGLVLAVRFRGPLAFNSSDVWNPSVHGPLRAAAYGHALRAWSDREQEVWRLCPLAYDTATSYSKAALIHSVECPAPPLTSISDVSALQFVSRMTKGGRLLTGCAVLHHPLSSPATDRRVVRLSLDFTAKYPDVLKRWPLPHQEHTLSRRHAFTSDLAAGVAFISAQKPGNEGELFSLVEISGYFPSTLHPQLVQFPPLLTRRPVAVSEYTPFQRARMGLRLSDAPVVRTVAHLGTLHTEVVCVREAQILQRLGFVFTHIGDVYSCVASFWARSFMATAERRRRSAAACGDNSEVAAVKLITNSVIGAMNMNTAHRFELKPVFTSDVSFDKAIATGQDGLSLDDTRSSRRSTRLADDPRFTGRLFTTGDLTLVELTARPVPHSQMTTFALAVQAYARCDHLEFMYGDGVRAGLLTAFPSARVMYANTDSVMVELTALHDPDARVVLWKKMKQWLDLSNVPAASSFWTALTDAERAEARLEATEHAGEWGRVKEETGFAGIDVAVVNGPNRYAYRVVQSPTDTLTKHSAASDVMKNLPAAWHNSRVEHYALDWVGSAARAVPEFDDSEADSFRPTCIWGNGAAVVAADGSQWPLGASLEAFPALAAAMADSAVVSL